MPELIRIVWFLLVGAFGFLTVSIVFFVAMFTGSLPENFAGTGPNFAQFFLGGMMWAWILGLLLGVMYLFVKNRARVFFLWAPVYLPVLYAPFVLAFFS
ncbi:MAG: hypothetical protein EOM26_09820 [Alphaproteobacteria bacterium]|nr:hypothetical protein [Alphaproteobacteria bacterium]